MTNKPKLQNYAVLGFLYHQNTQPLGLILHRTRRFHGFLLCRRYLMEFCRERPNEQLSVFVQDTWLSIIRMIKNCRIEFTFMDGRSISTLIRLAQLDAIHLNLWSRTLTSEFTKSWTMICKALEENQTLQRLEVTAQMPRECCNRFLIDCLPDKITKFNTDPEICFVLGERQPLEFMGCFVQQMNLYYYRLFQIKTKHLEFFHDYDGGLWELANCGPLLPNPTLKKLKIHFHIGNFIEEYNEEEPMNSKFNKDLMPAYRDAIKCLCEVNPAMHLKLYDWSGYGLNETIPDAVQQLYNFIRNAKVFIDLANEIGLKKVSIRIQQQVLLKGQTKENWTELNQCLADEFQMEKKGNNLVAFVHYNGSKIKLMQDTNALFREDNEGSSILDLINFEIGQMDVAVDEAAEDGFFVNLEEDDPVFVQNLLE